MVISQYTEKLNKLDDNIYTIEEVVHPVNGIYESELLHDNIVDDSVTVYTGKKLTGNRAEFTLSTPSNMPWKKVIRIYSTEGTLYVNYETTGDTVEAEDINKLQEDLIATQTAVTEENQRSMKAEEQLDKKIDSRKEDADTVNGHTVNADVPKNADFTNTWRGVQDNLESDSKDESLSAAQGKKLKRMITDCTPRGCTWNELMGVSE